MSTEASTNKGFHFAWVIFIGCCAAYATAMGLVSSIAGIYMLPVSESIGVSRGDFALWITIKSFTGVAIMPLVGWLFSRMKSIKPLMIVGSLAMTIGIFGFSISRELWQFFCFAPLLGIGSTTFYTIAAPTLVQNWFGKKYRGKFLGIAAAFTGIGTFVWSPLFTFFLNTLGWSTTYMINAAFIFVLSFPFALVAIRTPEDKGLLPYGYDPAVDGKEENAEELKGAKVTTAVKCAAFWLMIFGALCVSLGAGFNNHQPAIAKETLAAVMDTGAAAMVGATMISTAAVGNLLGKIIYGFIVDRLGIKSTTLIFLIFFLCALLLWMFGSSVPVLLVGSFLFGTHNAIVSVAFPMIIRNLFGPKNFAKIWSWWSMPFTLMGGFSTSIIGYVYAFVGDTYATALVIGCGLVILAGILILAACAFIGKVKWDDDTPTPVETAAE